MTTITATACVRCGSSQVGTRFCEACGAPVASQAQGAPSTPVSANTDVGATPVRVVTLVFFLLAELAPGWLQLANSNGSNYLPELWRGSTVALVSITGLFALISAVAGRAGAAGKTLGALLAITYVAVYMVILYAPINDYTGNTTSVLLGVAYLSLYLSWAFGRPFRGNGYFGLLVLIAASVLLGLLQYIPGITSSYSGWMAVISLAVVVGVALVVGLSIAFEGKMTVASTVVVAAPGASVPAGGLGKTALGLVLGSVGVQAVSSVLLGFVFGYALGWLGTVLSLVAFGMLVAGIACGHVAVSRARRSGARRDGLGLAALIVAYSLIGLGVLALIIQLILFATIMTAFS